MISPTGKSRVTVCLLVTALSLGPLRSMPLAQEAAASGIAQFRITSSLVVVDFLVIDKTGQFVTDLKEEEIEIFEDGQKQTIHSFYPPGMSLRGAFVSPGDLPKPGGIMPQTETPGSVSTPGATPLATTILIDSRVMDSNNFVHSVAAIRQFIEEHLAANHELMLAEIHRGLRILSPMTRDRERLLEAVDQLRPQTVFNPLAVNVDMGPLELENYFDDLQQQVLYVGEGLKSICYAMAGRPGRKHVVYFSEGYPMDPLRDLQGRRQAQADRQFRGAAERQDDSRQLFRHNAPAVLQMVRDVVDVANRMDVSFYAIDARGLIAVQGVGSPDRSGDVAAGPKGSTDPRERAAEARSGRSERVPSERIVAMFTVTDLNLLEDAQNTLVALAAGTNGAAFFNTNDLESVLRASTAEQEQYYVASYVPTTKRREGRFHSIQVKTTRPGVLIRARKGYLDLPDDLFRQTRLETAFRNPELFQQLTPLVQLRPSSGRIEAVIGVPSEQVAFLQNGQDYRAEILFLGQIFDERNKPISKEIPISRGFNLSLTADQFRGLTGQPMLARNELKLSRGNYRLVLVAEDRLSGALGAVVEEFQVP